MKSPQQKYLNDPNYHMLCDILENNIRQAQFTPSEVRECAVLACIHYEERQLRKNILVPTDVILALDVLADYRKREG